MAKGRKTGGRKPGTPNKPPNELEPSIPSASQIFAKLGGPGGERYALELHRLALGEFTVTGIDIPVFVPVADRIKALGIIATYVWAKPKETQEHTGPGGGPVLFGWQK